MTVTPASTSFVDRHIGARRQADVDAMLKAVGYDTVDALVDTAVPKDIRQDADLALAAALSEVEVLAELRRLAAKNKTAVQMIGQGYYDTVTPAVIRRNILEAPAWYTAYTPYQPEISQGRLEALLNFQTMVQDLVGLPIANASLLDEATAVAEAVLMMRRANKNKTAHDGKTVLDADCLPQTIAIVKGRAEALGFEVEVADLSKGLPGGVINGVVLQQPGVSGRVFDHTAVIAEAKERGALVIEGPDGALRDTPADWRRALAEALRAMLEAHPEALRAALATHPEALQATLEAHPDALRAALEQHPQAVSEALSAHPEALSQALEAHHGNIGASLRAHSASLLATMERYGDDLGQAMADHSVALVEALGAHPGALETALQAHPEIYAAMAGEHVRAMREYAEHQAQAGQRFSTSVEDWIRAADAGLSRVEGQQQVLAPLVALAHERLAGEAEALDQIVTHLRDRRAGRALEEPTGVMTHHLVHDEDCWTFLRTLVTCVAAHPAAAWCDPFSDLSAL